MTRFLRGRTALVGCVLAGVVASAVMAQGAAAQQASDPNPLSTNVPYLAWRGEHVRLVKCTNDLSAEELDVVRAADTSASDDILIGEVKTDVLVEDWSGDAHFQPQVAAGTIDLYLSDDGLCVKADVISQKAGLAVIKLVVTVDLGSGNEPLLDILTRSDILGVHQFLVGWMQLGTPELTELPVGGDAATLNTFIASDDPRNDGILRVELDGTMPMGNNFSELGLGEAIRLPDDWPRLAAAMASDRNPDNASPQWRWDIHDDQTLAEGHVQYGPVNTTDAIACNDHAATSAELALFGDAVDNCEGGQRFSRWFDADGPSGPLAPIGLPRSAGATVGPFDPQRPEETFLGDGFLTPDDAPMPAARVDVAIAANAGGADLGGVGSLHKTDKHRVFSRDRAATANAGSGAATPHNLYAPYYHAYIPATGEEEFLLAGDPVSGTDGPPQGNNFPGFLVGDGLGGEGDPADVDNLYDFWDIAHVFRAAQGGDTTCLNRTDERPAFRQLPRGAQSVAVYTDEHGQAHVNYRPGTGAYYDALGAIRNANGGCDLAGIDVLGTSAITANARYPYQPTTDIAPRTSGTITKTVRSAFAKFLMAFPKGPGAENENARIVVAHAQDVDGSPEAGEVVCFINTSDNGAVIPYEYDGFNQRVFGGYDVAGSTRVADDDERAVCMRTNRFGNAAVEVFESEGEPVDVVAFFRGERLLRDMLVSFTGNDPQPNPTPQPPAPGSGGGGAEVPAAGAVGNTTPSPAQAKEAVQAAQAVLGAAASGAGKASAGKKALARLRFARLSTSTRGARTLSVRLEAGGKSATVRIKLFNRKGKAVKTVIRRLPVGRTVKVSGLRITKAHVRASVKVIG